MKPTLAAHRASAGRAHLSCLNHSSVATVQHTHTDPSERGAVTFSSDVYKCLGYKGLVPFAEALFGMFGKAPHLHSPIALRRWSFSSMDVPIAIPFGSNRPMQSHLSARLRAKEMSGLTIC